MKCVRCGLEFEPRKNKTRKYCYTCKRDWGEIKLKICIICGASFYPKCDNNVTCSWACRGQAQHEKLYYPGINIDNIKESERFQKDPESLFCDTEFLEKLMGRKPAPAKVCEES